MAYYHWSLEDIPWDRFESGKLDADLVRVVKAASMVEYNGGDYAAYLCNVFDDDADFQVAAKSWAAEEVQHGEALGRHSLAELAAGAAAKLPARQSRAAQDWFAGRAAARTARP